MTDPHDVTRKLGDAAGFDPTEATQVLPVGGDGTSTGSGGAPGAAGGSVGNEPTAPLPASPWARPTEATWPAPVSGTRLPTTPSGWSSTQPVPVPQAATEPLGTQPLATPPTAAHPYGPPTQPYGSPTQPYGPPTQPYGPPTQPYGPPTQRYGPPTQPYGSPTQTAQPGGNPSAHVAYGQPGNPQQANAQQPHAGQPGYGQQPYGQQPYGEQPYGQAYRDPANGQPYPQHPGYYDPSQYYYQQPTATTRARRWPLALAAIIAAFALVAGGFVLTARTLEGVLPSTTTTTPALEPSAQEDPTQNQGEEQPGRTGTTTGNGVSEAQAVGVVLIEAETSSGLAAGTGMILSADGKVLTNYHVVAGSEGLSVTVADSGDTYVATVLGFDQTRDVALLQLKDAGGLTPVTVDSDDVSVGDEVAAVGNANGGGVLVKAPGSVTAEDQDLTVSSDSPWGNTEDLSGLVQTTAAAVPGDSGGPMFDAENEVLGMTTAGSTDEGTSYAVPIATALSVVEQIETGADAGTVRVGPAGYLGIKVADSERGTTGKTITQVVSGSPAGEAGVTAGSRLTKVGDTTITAGTNLATVIRALEPGEKVTIEWTSASGRAEKATVTLGSSPVN